MTASYLAMTSGDTAVSAVLAHMVWQLYHRPSVACGPANQFAGTAPSGDNRNAGSIFSANANPPKRIPAYSASPPKVFQKNGTPAIKQVASEQACQWQQERNPPVSQHRAGKQGHCANRCEVPGMRRNTQHGRQRNQRCDNSAAKQQ